MLPTNGRHSRWQCSVVTQIEQHDVRLLSMGCRKCHEIGCRRARYLEANCSQQFLGLAIDRGDETYANGHYIYRMS
jgi:hypothetical protein